MFMEEQNQDRMNVKRTLQLLHTGARTIASACPFCMTMLTDGIKSKSLEDEVKQLDVAELLDKACEELPLCRASRSSGQRKWRRRRPRASKSPPRRRSDPRARLELQHSSERVFDVRHRSRRQLADRRRVEPIHQDARQQVHEQHLRSAGAGLSP